jgi:hypothetical protein
MTVLATCLHHLLRLAFESLGCFGTMTFALAGAQGAFPGLEAARMRQR